MESKPTDQELTALSEEVIKRLKELEESKDWKENGVKPCQMFKMGIDARAASKGIAVVDFNINKVFEFLGKQDTLGKINTQLVQIKVLHEKPDVFRVNYMQYKAIWPVANREFVNVSKKLIENESKIYIGTRACNYPYPEDKKIVRGECYIGGYILEKIDEDHTKVTYISDADLKGNIPGMVKNTLSAKQGEIASRIQDAMKKDGY